MSQPEPTQQDFLRAAKAELGLTWDKLAEEAGIEPRALKTYRMPAESNERRPLPSVARRAIELLVQLHRKKKK